jgi:hypothetical protein
MRQFKDDLHRNAAADDTAQASQVVDHVKHGKSEELLAKLPHDESLMKEIDRRREGGSRKKLDGVPFGKCELPPGYSKTRDGVPFLLRDVRRGRPLSPISSPVLVI